MIPNSSTVLVIIGGIALLIGLLGGGIEVSQIKFPHLDKWQRAFAGLVGGFLIVLGLVLDPSVRNPLSESITAAPTAALAPTASLSTTSNPESSTEPDVVDPSFDSPSSESDTDALPTNSGDTALIELPTPPLGTPTVTNTPLPVITSTATATAVTPTPSFVQTPVKVKPPHDTPAPSPTALAATFTPTSEPLNLLVPSPTMVAAMTTPYEDWHRGLNYAPDKNSGCNDSVGVNYQPLRCTDPLENGQSEYVSILLLARAKTGLDQQKMNALWQDITAMAPQVFKGGYHVDPNLSQAYLVYDHIGAYGNDRRWDIVLIEYGSAEGRLYIIPPGQYDGSIPDDMEAIRVY